MRLHSQGVPKGVATQIIGKITTTNAGRDSFTQDHVIFWNQKGIPVCDAGVKAVVTPLHSPDWPLHVPLVHSVHSLDYLENGDIVQIYPNGFVRTLYRKNSSHNFLLVTEQCNSYCLMCSQPPKKIDDSDQLLALFQVIDLMDRDTKELGITGGEPTLFKDTFISLIRHCKEVLPKTALHVLTNGRMFYYRKFAAKLAEIRHQDLILGIPLYSDVDSEHDYVVQSRGAFDQTVLGLHNLAKEDVGVEIRVVIHKQTYKRLPRLAKFIARNFPFVCHVALMGLENTGFTRANFESLWVDPLQYQRELRKATEVLFLAGLDVSIYNHQLCVIDRSLWPYACKSISDWKNIYLEPCDECQVKSQCGGFFQSSIERHSIGIKPIKS